MDIAIPSAYRADKKARSLEQLSDVDGTSVTFYVPDDQVGEYLRFLPKWVDVASVPNCDTVNVARNAIHSDYAGQRIVVMEDDVPWFVASRHCVDPRLHTGPPSSPRLTIVDVAKMGWAALDSTGAEMWGVYPVAYSGTALKPRVGVGSLFLVGHAVGLDLRHGWAPRLELPIKEDYELTALALERTGRVVRLDLVAPYSTSGKGEGGTRVYRNPQQEAAAADALCARWPQWFTPKPTEREGLAQVAMDNTGVKYVTVTPEAGWAPYGQ
jgi:hypothetical protein